MNAAIETAIRVFHFPAISEPPGVKLVSYCNRQLP
jgi:hypothetical protein